jgi:hypothetical protein
LFYILLRAFAPDRQQVKGIDGSQEIFEFEEKVVDAIQGPLFRFARQILLVKDNGTHITNKLGIPSDQVRLFLFTRPPIVACPPRLREGANDFQDIVREFHLFYKKEEKNLDQLSMIHDHLSVFDRIERTPVRDVLCELSHVVATLTVTVPVVSTLGHLRPPFINDDPCAIMVYIQIEVGFVVCVTRAAHAPA